MRQEDLARQYWVDISALGRWKQEELVDTASVTNWEKGHTSPRLHLIPRIIEFLEYVPFSGEGKRL